jgi:hypothetical protein
MEKNCPKCQRQMEAGFVLDRTFRGGAAQSAWIEGTPRPSFWTGLRFDRAALKPVTTYRCPGCGYLESYTRVYA